MAEPVRVGALILAAGRASRMGQSKLTMEIGGVAILARTAAALAEAGLPARLVTGAHAEATMAAVPALPRIHAEAFADGLSASIRAGIAAVPADWGAVLLCLGDMPFVQPGTLTMLAAALARGADAVVPVHAGAWGNPAGFSRAHFPDLLALDGDRGARILLQRLRPIEIAVPDPGIHRDIDRPEDLPT